MYNYMYVCVLLCVAASVMYVCVFIVKNCGFPLQCTP